MAMLHPVFWDPTGKRPFRVVCGALILTLMIIAAGVFCWRNVMTPVSQPLMNGDIGYPSALLSGHDTHDMPIIGNTESGILNRVVKVERREDGVYLVDPYTNDVIRQANDLDLEQIKDRTLAIDYFGNSPPDKQLMLTFDDGPDARYTPQILDILARESVPATFFVLGESVARNPGVMRRIVREGHMAGNHTLSHRDFDDQGDLRNHAELMLTDRVIRAAADYETPLFRIPRADPDNNALALLHSQQQGMVHVNLDIDTLDWSYEPGKEVPIPELDGRGHVVLMHDSGGDRAATVKMLETLIATAKAQGYTFSTVAPLLSEQQMPQKGIDPQWADRVTLWAFQGIWVLPGIVLTSLFWLGMGSLTIMTIIYLVLALVFQWHQRKESWSGLTDDKLPYVSVVLAAYNEAAVIGRTLDALRGSTYPLDKLEVIVVDDGSTDETLLIARAYAREWPLLKVLTQPNAGKSTAMNTGIAHMRPESTVVVTLDADTIFLPSTVYYLARHFVPGLYSEQMGVVAGHIKVGNRRNLLTAWQSLEYVSGITVTRTAEGFMGAISIVPGACSAWSRVGLAEVGGFSSVTLAEDADVTLALQKMHYKVTQENGAIAYTEAPESIRALAKQRKRWMFGVIQVLWKHRAMILRPRYGTLGMVSLPYAAISLLVPLVFMPVTVVAAVMNLMDGNWESVALFAAFVAGMHLIVSVAAVIMANEKLWHLLIVPIYRLIYEPLRAYLLFVSVFRVISGRSVEWNKLERTNNVDLQYASQ